MYAATRHFALLLCVSGAILCEDYFGKRLGFLSTLEHGVSGEVYAVDSRTIHVRNFHYDGRGPDAYFYAGRGTQPSGRGFIIPDEDGSSEPLSAYHGEDITLTLPNSHNVGEIQWLSVWCKAFSVDFGNLIMPEPIVEYPRPQRIGKFTGLEHGVSSDDIVVVDAQTLMIPKFSYDGQAPDAHFWVGRTESPGPSGMLVLDENGESAPLRRYKDKTIVITLPDDLTIFDITYLSVWCEQFYVDFGHIKFNSARLLVPPSLKMLGVKPQSKLNCEQLDADTFFEVRWAVAGESIVLQLVSRIGDGEYMAFGLSGDSSRTRMNGGDVVVAWMDQQSGHGFAIDYHLQSKSQCSGGQGTCPDQKLQGGDNHVRLLNSAFINRFSMLTLQRPLAAYDSWDKPILTNQSQAVIWAVGPLNSKSEASYHRRRIRDDLLIDFGRNPTWNCPQSGQKTSGSQITGRRNGKPPSRNPSAASSWRIPDIPCNEPADGVLYAQIGPSGGERGYTAITGRVGWGIAWYINGLLVPEVHVVRGRTYTFVVEGGENVGNAARLHPFYITDDPEGGYKYKTPEQRKEVRVFAGVGTDSTGEIVPTATGRLCQWTEDPDSPAELHSSFGAYQRTLKLVCEEGQPGILQWTPDENTPDTVYYQCFTHRYLGWKIHVHNGCDLDDGARSAEKEKSSNSRQRGRRTRG